MDFRTLTEIPGHFAGKHPVEASTIIPQGVLVALNAAGNAVPASSTITGFVIGRAEQGVDNSAGAAGAVSVTVRRGVFTCQNDDTHAPTKADVGTMLYVTAPDTVSTLNTVTCRGGILIGFDDAGLPMVDFTRTTKA